MATRNSYNPKQSPHGAVSVDELRQCALFDGLEATCLAWLSQRSSVCILPAGHILLRPDQPNHHVYVLLAGRLKVELGAGAQRALTYLEAGHCVGEMSVIEGAFPSATVATFTECRLLMLRREVVWALIERSAEAARNLLRMLSARLRNDNAVLLTSLERQRIYAERARLDAVTGLYNRHWLHEALPQLIEAAKRSGQPFSLLMLDVDHFKAYNDRYGHLAGDRALVAVATALREQLDEHEAAARYGGEEMAVALPGSGSAAARARGEALRTAIAHWPITAEDGRRLPSVCVSIGMASWQTGQSSEALLKAADQALYRAKATGRNRVCG